MSIIKRIYHDQKITECITKKLYEMQKSGELCDYKLTTEDGGSFKVHKWILSTVSPFFVKLLNTEFRERDSDTFMVRRVSSSVLEKIIEFMYIGKTEISSDTAKEVIDIALFLNLFTLAENGYKVLAELVNEQNCLEWLKYSETCLHYGEELTKACLKLVCKTFNDFVNLPDFLELSSDTIKLLVVQKRTSYSEENLFLAVKKWITHDLENRKQYVKCLFDSIQLKFLTSEFADSHIFDDGPLLQVKEFNEKLLSLLRYNWIRKETFASQSEPEEEENLCVIAGNEMLLHDNSKTTLFKVVTYVKENYSDFGYTTFDKNVFICGGKIHGKIVNTCSYFSVQNNAWKNLPSLEFARCPKSITLGEKIYACGSLTDLHYATTEVFDINRSYWFETCPLNNIRTYCYFDLCHLDNCIYFVNRYGVQRLDPRQYWETLFSGDLNKNIYSVEACGNYIYPFSDNSISRFDIRNNKWLDIVIPYKVARSTSPRTCVLNNRIYVLSCKKSGDGESTKYQLQSYNLSDLSFCEFKYVSANGNGDLKAFFSL